MNKHHIYNKRFKITILSISLCAAFGLVGIFVGFETVGTIALGGVEAIAIAFIAGDSYRVSAQNKNNNETEE